MELTFQYSRILNQLSIHSLTSGVVLQQKKEGYESP